MGRFCHKYNMDTYLVCKLMHQTTWTTENLTANITQESCMLIFIVIVQLLGSWFGNSAVCTLKLSLFLEPCLVVTSLPSGVLSFILAESDLLSVGSVARSLSLVFIGCTWFCQSGKLSVSD